MTKAALDSAYAPTAAQIAAAKAAGYIAWFGYFKFGNDGILNGWSDADFQRVLDGGLQTGAYWSGYADPLQVKARAARLGIRARLDVEGGLRPDGPWVQGALDAAGSGLYGNWPVFAGRTASDSIVAAYPTSGDPGNESWPSWIARPASGACGWQWAGSHSFAGITVDSTWLDDGFFAFTAAGQELTGGLDMATADQILAAVTMSLPPQPPSLAQYNYQPSDLQAIVSTRTWDSIKASYGADGEAWLYQYSHPVTVAAAVAAMQVEQTAMKAEVDALKSGQPADLSVVIAAQVAAKAAIDAIKAEEDALKAQVDATKADVDAVKQKTDRDLV